MRATLLAILVGTLLSGCGATEVIDVGHSTYITSAQELLLAGGWPAALREAVAKGTAYCAAKGQQFNLANEARSGTPGFTPLTSEIRFSCGSNDAAVREVDAQCANDMQSADLDPIRTKVELVRSDASAPAPFATVTNDTFATPQERRAIERWAALREECQKRTSAANAVSPAADPLQTVVIQQDRAFSMDAAGRVSALIVALYQGELTYGEFAQKRYEIGRDAGRWIAARSSPRRWRRLVRATRRWWWPSCAACRVTWHSSAA